MSYAKLIVWNKNVWSFNILQTNDMFNWTISVK